MFQCERRIQAPIFLALVASVFAYAGSAGAVALNPSGSYEDAKVQSIAFVRKFIPTIATMKMDSAGSGAVFMDTGKKEAPAAQTAPISSTALSAYAPPAPIGQGLRAPASEPVANGNVSPAAQAGVSRGQSGVAVYDLGSSTAIPRLKIDRESRIDISRFALDSDSMKTLDDKVVHAFQSPEMVDDQTMHGLLGTKIEKVGPYVAVPDGNFATELKLNRTAFDKIALQLRPEMQLKLAKFVALSPDETRFLSGLLLYQQGDQCSAAVGLFHELSKSKGWEPEADYYLAMCSRKLGLNTDFFDRARRILDSEDVFYSRKILQEVGYEVPYELTEKFGLALTKAANNPKVMTNLDSKVAANVAYMMADFAAATERFKTTLQWAKLVPSSHPKYLQARFIEALAEYQAGSKEQALKIQEELLGEQKTERAQTDFQALVALNVARMDFQEQRFKQAHEAFLKVYKDHPLWLQSLTEMGWSQLMSGDYEGAIGNMYSVQSPFFANVYKPESYVIRTIGYLNLCQYGDAYRTLSTLEHEYRPQLEKIEKYMETNQHAHYQTVRDALGAAKGVKEVDGLPVSIVREMARHRDFTNLQKALNHQLDERPLYSQMDVTIDKDLKHAEWLVGNSRRHIAELRKQLSGRSTGTAQNEQARKQWALDLSAEMAKLNDLFFQVDLYNEAKAALPDYHKDVIGGADERMALVKEHLQKVLADRLLRMKTDLARMLDNNELLRYEVFSGSGENIRYQVAGGERGKRVPASVIPKSKSLHWDFDGEYWEDEVGHYRSSLTNNCADNKGQASHQASNGGDE